MTPLAQHLVRAVGALGFVALIGAAPVLYVSCEHARTQASIAWPNWNGSAFALGELMKDWEKHLREASPITVELRGHANETQWRLGILESKEVHIGPDGWLFFHYGLNYDPNWWLAPERGYRDKRIKFLRGLHAACESLGIKLLALVVPDKDRIYPEQCWRQGVQPEPKRGLYQLVQEELRLAGIASFDVATPMLEHKLEHPEQLLFHPRDTHWTYVGARVAAQLTRARLQELGWLETLGSEVALRTGGEDQEYTPDLVGMLGFRAGSALVESLRYRYVGEFPQMPDGSRYERECADASVALCGTSYSAIAFGCALPLALRRVVDESGVISARGPFLGLLQAVERIRAKQLLARVIVWEFPERSVLEFGWLDPPEPPAEGR